MSGSRHGRGKLLPVVHTLWKQLRKDLSDPDELREQRLAFIGAEIGRPVNSMKDMSGRELGLVIDALRSQLGEKREPASRPAKVARSENVVVTGSFGRPATGVSKLEPAEVVHLASSEQAWLISALFDRLRWPSGARSKFLVTKFKTNSLTMLKKAQAQSAITILLTIVCSNEIKAEQPGVSVSREMVKQRIPSLLREIKSSIEASI